MTEKVTITTDGLEEAIDLLETYFNTQKEDKSYEIVSLDLVSLKRPIWRFLIYYPIPPGKPPHETMYFDEVYVVFVQEKVVKEILE